MVGVKAEPEGRLGDHLELCSVSVMTWPYRDVVEGAASAGFDTISVLARSHRRALAREGLSTADMRTMAEDHGLSIGEVEAVADWLSPAPADTPERFAPVYDGAEILDVAAELGAKTLVAVHQGDPVGLDHAAARLGDYCDRAAARGIDVALEFPAFFTINDVATAWAIAERSGRANAGILVDSWHHYRSTGDDDALAAVPAARIFALQLADGAADPVGSLAEDVTHRRLPGEGDLPLARLLRRLDAAGLRIPVGVEVFDPSVLELGRDAAVARLGSSLRRVLAEAYADDGVAPG